MTCNPTNDLLQFYKNKALEYDKDIKDLGNKLDNIKKVILNQSNYWREIKEKNEEIFHMQALMTKMEICLMKEKENILRLTAYNDDLRIKDIENKNRIKELESFLFQEEKGRDAENNKNIYTNSKAKDASYSSGYCSQPELSGSNISTMLKEKNIIMLQINALKLETEEQRRFITINMEKVIIKNQENEEKFKDLLWNDSERHKNTIHRLTTTQELLCQTSKDLADMKRIYHKNEELSKIKEQSLYHNIKDLESQIRHLQISRSTNLAQYGSSSPSLKPYCSEANLSRIPKKEKLLDQKIKQFDTTAKIYKDKFLDLETQHEILREQFEADHRIYKERNEALTKKLETAEAKYSGLMKRKNFDRQGYQADIGMLKDKVKQLERLLYKATLNLNNEGKNREILDNMNKMAEDSKKMILNEKKSRLELLELEEKLNQPH